MLPMQDPWFAFQPLLAAALRSTVLIGLAALVVLSLRRAPAAVRHLVWTLAIVGSVAMPFAARIVPGWSLPVLAPVSIRVEPSAPAAPAPRASQASASLLAEPMVQDLDASLVTSERPGTSARAVGAWRPTVADLFRILPLAWLAGVALLVARLGFGWVRLSRLARLATPVGDRAWRGALAGHAASLRLRRTPSLRVSARVDVPFVCGTLRPVIVLPVAAGEWSAERRDAVLLHELAHVRRRDLVTARFAQLATTLYWFNPVVWFAVRSQRAEAERACDDQVLHAGQRASAYAADLLEIARAVGGREPMDSAALAMARRSQLEGRLLAILDPRLRRGSAGPGTVLVALTLAIAAVGAIAAGRPAQGQPTNQAERIEPATGVPVGEPLPALLQLSEPKVIGPDASKLEVNATPAPTAATAGSGALLAAAATTNKAAAEVSKAASASTIEVDGISTTGNWNHRDSRGTMLTARGTIRYSANLDDIVSISPGGWVEIEDKRDGPRRKATLKGRADGGIDRTYQVDGKAHPWDAEARTWLAAFLLDIDRGSGTFVEQRFPLLMKEGGPDRVLREIAQMRSDYGRGLYYRKLFASGIQDADMRKAVTQAGKEMDSDYELTQVLVDAARHNALSDAATRTAYLEAANTLQSDYEHGRALHVLVERRELSPALVEGAIASAARMSSDYEQAQVMVALAEKGHVKGPAQRAYIMATQSLDSDYERGRVLKALMNANRLESDHVDEMLAASAAFSSDYERANLLIQLVRSATLTEATRAAYVRSARAMSSDYERQRALAALGETFGQ